MPETTAVPLHLLALEEHELQPRETIDRALVAEYAAMLSDGVELPPVIVFRNGADKMLLADGWHRAHAHKAAKRKTIAVEIHEGGFDEALVYSLQANATHGKRRTVETLERAYEIACKRGVITDPADMKQVRTALAVSKQRSEILTKKARDINEGMLRSIAYALHTSKGMTQEKIAAEISKHRKEVTRQTVANWIANLDVDTQTGKGWVTTETVDKMLAKMQQLAREELEPALRANMEQQVKEKIEGLRQQLWGDWEAERVELRQTIDSAQVRINELMEGIDNADDRAREAAEQALAVEREKLQTAQAKLKGKAAQDALDEAARTKAEADKAAMENRRQFHDDVESPAAKAWWAVLAAIEQVMRIDVSLLQRQPYPPFERTVLKDAGDAIDKLNMIVGLAEGRNERK